MMRRFLSIRLLALAAAASAVCGEASAQGTAAQRQACAPDAIRLCQDTIPDVGRTTVCMRAHASELSPRCKAVFEAAAVGPATRRRPVAAARAVPRHLWAEARRHSHVSNRRDVARDARDPDAAQARRVIGRLCAEQMLGSDTCAFTASVLRLAD